MHNGIFADPSWMNHIPQTMVKKIKRLLYCFQAIDESEPASGHQTSSSAPPLAVTEVEDFTIQETTDEVEVFLAELRRSTLAHAAPFSSNREREEFISNLLITEVRPAKAATRNFVDPVINLI